MVDNDTIEKTIKKFNDDNGNRSFSTKELVIFFNKQHEKTLTELKSDLKEHIKTGNIKHANLLKFTADHDKIIQHITDELSHVADSMPAKGFCEKTQNIINCWQPDKREPPLHKKVDNLWYDRKLIKFLTGALVIAIITSASAIVITFIS